MSAIPDFTESDEWIVQTTLKERYGRNVALQNADADIRLNPADHMATERGDIENKAAPSGRPGVRGQVKTRLTLEQRENT